MKKNSLKKLVILRRIVQVFFLCLFTGIIWSLGNSSHNKIFAKIFFITDPLLMSIVSISSRAILEGLVFSFFMVLFTFMFGRFFCGWMCPLGSIMDFFGVIRRKYGRPSKLKNFKYIILFIIFMFALFGIQIAWIMDPITVMGKFVTINLIPGMTLAVNNIFMFFIKDMGLHGVFQDAYRYLREFFIGTKIPYFSNAVSILMYFLLITGSALFISRFWCRFLCPLGAFYGIIAKKSFLSRKVNGCVKCKKCVSHCRMGAIKDGENYSKDDCILCMECIYDCPKNAVEFSFTDNYNAENTDGISRRKFLLLIFSSFFIVGLNKKTTGGRKTNIIRPPGAQNEKEFLDRCVRCGNCMKVCPTGALQPVLLKAGLGGIWTPELVPEIGYCEYNCNLCGGVCPTKAIPKLSLEAKKKTRLGTASVNKSLCFAWRDNMECLVCQEHCPLPEKAIKVFNDNGIPKPIVDEKLCIGCGICQNKCPASPIRAIRVS